MYVYVCMYVYMYECMYACMYVRMYTYNICMCVWFNVCMYMYVCNYVCMYTYIHMSYRFIYILLVLSQQLVHSYHSVYEKHVHYTHEKMLGIS